jgi:histone deacetylase complex regulatory component SIN3
VRIVRLIPLLGFALFQFQCVSSEETGAAGGRARTPQRVRRPVQTSSLAQQSATARDSVRTAADTINAASQVRRTPTFATRQDTVRASLVRRQQPSRVDAPIARPENPEYTIQLGAFFRAENALRAQKHARQQFPDQPIFNTFLPEIKLYRVSVGRFSGLRDAGTFRRAVLKEYPKEYLQCWINYVAR